MADLEVAVKPEIFSERVIVWLGPIPLTPTMLTTFATSLAIVFVAMLLTHAIVRWPTGRLAAAGRLAVGFLHDLVSEAAGESWLPLEAFGGTLFLFIAGTAVVGQLPGVAAPTSNIAATSALAILVFIAVPLAGIHARGFRAYFGGYFRPNPLLFPLHVISELSRTVALALRLFGNMMSGHLVVGLIVALVGFFVPVPLMALDLLIGLLQAYIFTILACVYVGAAIRVAGE
jgi:F-type H+-transporting ATPase subunit a